MSVDLPPSFFGREGDLRDFVQGRRVDVWWLAGRIYTNGARALA